jgi:hypothetical protein
MDHLGICRRSIFAFGLSDRYIDTSTLPHQNIHRLGNLHVGGHPFQDMYFVTNSSQAISTQEGGSRRKPLVP